MKTLFSKFLDLIFPRHCICCGKVNPQDGFKYLCASCAYGPYIFQVNRCLQCAEIIGSDVIAPRCSKCETQEFYFSSALVACEYSDAGRELAIELKYRNGIWAASDIAKIASKSRGFPSYFNGSVIVPVPLSAKRKRKRGYNQSELMANAIAKENPVLNIKVKNILRRNKDTSTQTRLTLSERILNVKNAFEIRKNNLDKNSQIIILDDVMTTGSTLNECARILKKAGFKNIKVFAFARRS